MAVVGGPRIGAIIPYRMAASRLPNKPLADVAGKTALDRVVDRARGCKYVSEIGIATTVEATDDALVAAAEARGLRVFRGSVNDVLARFAGAADAFGYDVVVEVDGDDLLASSEYMDLAVEHQRATGADMVSYRGLPIGATPNILTRKALQRAVREKSSTDTATGFFRFITPENGFTVELPVIATSAHLHPVVRMTLDYPQDLAFFSAVYAELDKRGTWTFSDLVALLHARPDLVAINQGLDEQYKAHFQAGIR